MRRKLLAAVIDVSHGLSLLHLVSENANHPRLEKFEQAVVKIGVKMRATCAVS